MHTKYSTEHLLLGGGTALSLLLLLLLKYLLKNCIVGVRSEYCTVLYCT